MVELHLKQWAHWLIEVMVVLAQALCPYHQEVLLEPGGTAGSEMTLVHTEVWDHHRPEPSGLVSRGVQEQLEHVEVSTALRYLGQYYFKNKLYDEASLCAQRCCDYNDVSPPTAPLPPVRGRGSMLRLKHPRQLALLVIHSRNRTPVYN